MSHKNLVDESQLQRVSSSWLCGFRPIYQKELAYWFNPRRWISQLIIWMSLTALPAIWMTPGDAGDRGISFLTLFLWLGITLIPISTVILAQGAIIEEKLTQTLLWIYSKPLSTAGFILGKFAAYSVFIGVIALGVPGIFMYIAALVVGLPAQISLFNYLISVLMVYLVMLFTLALTMMLGVIFNQIRAVSAISLFVFFGGVSLNFNPQLQQIKPYTVWALQNDATATLVDQFPNEAWIAMSVTIVFTVLFLLISVFWMKGYEL